MTDRRHCRPPASAAVIWSTAAHRPVAGCGRAYPEPSAYPPVIPAPVPTDHYDAKTIDSSLPADHADVVDRDRYPQIQPGHRIGLVQADDGDASPAG